jgi:tetratricopeptide (TPR) repeat protein
MHIPSRKFGFFVVCLIAVSLALPAAMAQQNRIIKGRVVDDKDQPVAGATIQIQAVDSKSRVYSTKTDKKGTFIYMGIAAGDYRVICRAQGFAPTFMGPVRPSIQEETKADFKLTPGQMDAKLPFEYTDQEIEQLKQEAAKAEKRKQASAEVQGLFDGGLKLAQEGKYTEAIEEFKKALEKDPEQPNIMGNMADAYSKMDKNTEALEIYQKAIAIKGDDAALWTNMGVILSKLGKNTESQEAFSKAASLNPAASAQNFYNIGATLVNNGKTAEAAESFKKAIAADANFAEAYYQLGMCLSGKVETMPDAIKALQKYIQIGQKPDQVGVAKDIIKALEQSVKK